MAVPSPPPEIFFPNKTKKNLYLYLYIYIGKITCFDVHMLGNYFVPPPPPSFSGHATVQILFLFVGHPGLFSVCD